ncbi:MAG: retropepsin-like domain-containing protein [Elusimicrobia bacterium]|nr:retropepsin-like domain-containing protein [Elusimicrobiota bacterium]
MTAKSAAAAAMVGAGILAAWAPAPACADAVHLNNGNVMEGVVLREDQSEIELDIGYGAVILPKSGIDRIVRSQARERQSLETLHRERGFESGRGIPPAAMKTFAQYQRLRAAHQRVVEAKTAADFSFDWLRQKEEEAASAALRPALEDLDKALRAAPAASGKTSGTPEETAFYAWLRRTADKMSRDVGPLGTTPVKRDLSFTVQVTINDKIEGSFLVEPDSSFVAITSKLAGRIGLKLAGLRGEVIVTATNGRRLKGQAVLLDCVQVGGKKARRIDAAVVDQLGPGIDGVLGRPFLRLFDWKLDDEKGVLTLEDVP